MTATRGLKPPALKPLDLATISPTGWLRDQLQVQACGLSGYLDEFWPDVAESGWIGGAAEGWERGPYWLDGMVALAAVTDNPRLLRKVQAWIDHIITHQAPDGWLGPEQDQATGRYEARDPWPVFVALKALTQWHDWWRDERVPSAVERCLRCIDAELDKRPLFSWGWVRWADLVISIHWLYDKTQQSWLLDMAAKVQAQGFDWLSHFQDLPFKERTTGEQRNLLSHVVNNAMAIKAPAVWWRQSSDEGDRRGTQHIITELDRYHGQVTGVFTGDEHLAGRDPSQGTELCAVVEAMFSLETAISILGDPALADRLERIAFNALPATFTDDMWAHQYDQQVNQVRCAVIDEPIYTSNGPDANTFGLEPNYGCCTANMHQGWPKFVNSLWMETADHGLAAISYAPCHVSHILDETTFVDLWVDGDYPFSEHVTLTVEVNEPITMTLYLRIPGWCRRAAIEGEGWTRKNLTPGRFVPIKRTWEGSTTITLHLPMPLVAEPRFNDSVAITMGPLVFSLPIDDEWHLLKGQPPHGDYEVTPSQDWAFMIELDREHPEASLEVVRLHPSWPPFSSIWAPIELMATVAPVANWGWNQGAAAPPPASPTRAAGEATTVWLVPYGAAKLRLTELPSCPPKQKVRPT